MSKKTYYITTPIYYPSGSWHIGTCYTTVICDALAKFKRMDGYDVFYLTGTDEHGQKIERKAQEANEKTIDFLNKQIEKLKELWNLLDIKYDKFIRTTDTEHKVAVQKIFNKLYEKGDIYKSSYEGQYCTPCESFWTSSQLNNGKCPDCGRDVESATEEAYFFRLSKYQDKLIELIEKGDYLQPVSRQNEMLNNFLRKGLNDLCISRTSFKWGIEVPIDPNHVIYVWLDALSNYITALGYGSDDETLFKKFWPANLHMTGKEIVRFHSIIWPAMLMSLDIPVPKQLYGHGWLLFGDDGEKMSKSKGNIIDPFVLSESYSVDAVRYFLLREVPFGNDGNFTLRAFLNRRNADLCNSLGNLLSRTTAMVTQNFGEVVPTPSVVEEIDNDLKSYAENLLEKVRVHMDSLNVPEALNEIFKLINRANKYIDETTPWLLAKDENKKDRLATVLYNLSEVLRLSAVLLVPFLKDTPSKILECFNLKPPKNFDGVCKFGTLKPGSPLKRSDVLFARIDVEKECK